MEKELENGINSLIAYYFETTNFGFIDEFDFRILINLVNICGIQLEIDDSKDSIQEIFNQFLSCLYEVGNINKGSDVIGINSSNKIWNNEKQEFESISRLEIRRNLMDRDERNLPVIDSRLIDIFYKIMDTDVLKLNLEMPNSDDLKKYIVSKKIISCKYENLDDFYSNNIATNEFYDLFDDWENKIYPKTYSFVENIERLFLEKNLPFNCSNREKVKTIGNHKC